MDADSVRADAIQDAARAQVATQAATLGFLAGYVDTLGFIALSGLFTAHVTGNFVMIGRALVEPAHDLLMKLLVFPVFILSVGASTLLIRRWQRRGAPALRYAVLLQLFLLAACMLCGLWAAPVAHLGAPLSLTTGMLGAAAMAVQNTFGKLLLAKVDATTVMTGNVTLIAIALTDGVRGDPAALAHCRSLAWPIAGFAMGAIGGALAWSAAGFHGLLLPCLMLALLAWVAPNAPGAAAASAAAR